jgi:hypothetical protein
LLTGSDSLPVEFEAYKYLTPICTQALLPLATLIQHQHFAPDHTILSFTPFQHLSSIHFQHHSTVTMYRCAAGGEMKPLAAYTASQQRRAKGNNRQNSGMVCKEHAQPAGLERYCHVCLRTLPIHKFSGNSRNDDEPVCLCF